jgi:hypothetical protein
MTSSLPCERLPGRMDNGEIVRTKLPESHEQRKIDKLLARLAQMKRDPKPEVPKQVQAA